MLKTLPQFTESEICCILYWCISPGNRDNFNLSKKVCFIVKLKANIS